MSYEYVAKPDPAFSLLDVIEASKLAGLAVVLSATRSEAQLRWTGLSLRPDWPEDVRIFHTGDQLLVQIHTGEQKWIQALLSRISESVRTLAGAGLGFEEV